MSCLSRCALPKEAEVGIALGHERQVRPDIHAAIAERLAVRMAGVSRALLFSFTSCNDVHLIREHIGKLSRQHVLSECCAHALPELQT